jgi:hypothetical protein
MRALFFLLTIASTVPALAAERHGADRRVYKIDSVIATRKGNAITIQAKGAVQSGGWKNARLHVIHSDRNAVTVEFLASAPPPGMTVIEALVPVQAQGAIRAHAPSVRVLAEANEMTAQVLHLYRGFDVRPDLISGALRTSKPERYQFLISGQCPSMPKSAKNRYRT